MRKEIIKSYLVMEQETVHDADLEISSVEENVLNDEDYDNNYSLQLVKDTYFKGTELVDHRKFLMIAIPYRKGWNVYIDGQLTPVYKGDYGFIAFQVNEGEHLIEVKYQNMIYPLGVMMSLAGIILWIILYKSNVLNCLFEKRNSK